VAQQKQNTTNNQEKTAKQKALEVTFSQIDKVYGKGSVMLLGQRPTVNVNTISSGSFLIDSAIGVGGFPRGRVSEVSGPESSGKTTLALQTVAEAQKQGGTCAFIDAEHALDPVYARSLGINIDDLIIAQPDYGEQALDIAEMLIRSGAVDAIVVDSVAALVPRNELDGDMGEAHVGLQARLMSQALRKLTPVVHKSKTSLIFINQLRQNINAMAFASKETTTGGNALKFYASLRLEVRRIESIKYKDGSQRGNRVRVKVAKNKMAPPFKMATVDLLFGSGVSAEYDLLDAALQNNIIQQSGAWFSYGDEKIGQGRDAAAQTLWENAALWQKIAAQVRTALGLDRSEQPSEQHENETERGS